MLNQNFLNSHTLQRRLKRTLTQWTFALCIAISCSGCAELDPAILDAILTTATAAQPLDEATVDRGLREALDIGIGRTVERTSSVDGFLGDTLLRISVPEEFEEAAQLLRKVGFSRQVDELEVTMNRAAEQAAGEAREIFVNAIRGMTIADAFGILRGGETAATDYLYARTADNLRERFEPIISTKMERVGLYRKYERLATIYNGLPSTRRPAVDLDTYLTERTLEGLFIALEDEERKIRRDPIARTTELLRRVFG